MRRCSTTVSFKANNFDHRLFPSFLVLLFQNESFCKTFRMNMSLICMKMTGRHFHMNGFARGLALRGRRGEIQLGNDLFNLSFLSKSHRLVKDFSSVIML